MRGDMMAGLAEIFETLPHQSKKHSSYFPIYETVFMRYRGRPITFVEIGVLNGGSLFMWRSWLGDEARIIGIDLNPAARKWESDGFEIYIGDQADPEFWKHFFGSVGQIDALLDDGGHTFAQQIVTTEAALPYIRDGGALVVEDTHTSYMKSFGGPSSRSFIEYAKNLADGLNFRSGMLDKKRFQNSIFSITFFESIVAFHVDRSHAAGKSQPVVSPGTISDAIDYRHSKSRAGWAIERAHRSLSHLKRLPLVGRLGAAVWDFGRTISLSILSRVQALRLGRYFRF